VNLAGGHFLKIGLALQEKVGGPADLNGAEALDLTIALFSGKTITELSEAKGREAAKAKLVASVAKAYENKVYDIYFTEFVMQ
jgi:flagellar FliL protein